jgi:hypothetical protein
VGALGEELAGWAGCKMTCLRVVCWSLVVPSSCKCYVTSMLIILSPNCVSLDTIAWFLSTFKMSFGWAQVAHACNTSYSGVRDQEDHSWKVSPGQIVCKTLS